MNYSWKWNREESQCLVYFGKVVIGQLYLWMRENGRCLRGFSALVMDFYKMIHIRKDQVWWLLHSSTSYLSIGSWMLETRARREVWARDHCYTEKRLEGHYEWKVVLKILVIKRAEKWMITKRTCEGNKGRFN